MLTAVSLPFTTLADLVQRSTFRIVRSQEREGGLLEVEFDNPHPIPKNSLDPVLGGTVVLDPDHSWCVRSSDVHCEDAGGKFFVRWKLTYSEPMEKFPILLRVEVDWTYPPGAERTILHEDKDYALREARAVPPVEEFTLSAFGMPEPPGITWKKPTPVYTWVIAAAALCGTLAFLFRYLAKRKPASPRTKVSG
jgi:hypothetical protein